MSPGRTSRFGAFEPTAGERAGLAIRSDLAAVRADLAILRETIITKADLAAFEVRMVKWMIAIAFGATTLTFVAFRLMV